MQIYKQWAIVVTLVVLKSEGEHAQVESFTSVQCNLCSSYARALLAGGAGVGIQELLKL